VVLDSGLLRLVESVVDTGPSTVHEYLCVQLLLICIHMQSVMSMLLWLMYSVHCAGCEEAVYTSHTSEHRRLPCVRTETHNISSTGDKYLHRFMRKQW